MILPTVDLVAAARPNFMKIAPLWHALAGAEFCRTRLVHTGQHYDHDMSDAFFRDLKLPAPDLHLNVRAGSHAQQTGATMVAYENELLKAAPDLVVVVGDVNATAACALAAKKLNLPVAHLEAGLRSGDRKMPEEINRIVTDSISDVLWTPSEDADDNLRREGHCGAQIRRVGNIMIDSFEMLRPAILAAGTRQQLGVRDRGYGLVTLHRPANVDDAAALGQICGMLIELAARLPLVFPVHPRTRRRLTEHGLLVRLEATAGLTMVPPLGYIDFMALLLHARLALTDSGGIQEESSYLDVPCLTLRDTTERPITLTRGTNRLVSVETLGGAVNEVLAGNWPRTQRIELWDGRTAERVAADIRRILSV